MARAKPQEQLKCIETRRAERFTYRRYVTTDGKIKTTYEVDVEILPAHILQGIINLKKQQEMNLSKRVSYQYDADPDRVDVVLQMLSEGKTMRQIAKELRISTTSIIKYKYGAQSKRMVYCKKATNESK